MAFNPVSDKLTPMLPDTSSVRHTISSSHLPPLPPVMTDVFTIRSAPAVVADHEGAVVVAELLTPSGWRILKDGDGDLVVLVCVVP